MNKMIKSIKEIHHHDVCLFKIGSFYHAYGRDSYILSYLFGYKIKLVNIEENLKECGFPICSVSKVMAHLEEKKINYILIDRRNNYDVDQKMDFGNLNTYKHNYEKANKYINYKNRIDNITSFLTNNIENKEFTTLINKMEEVIANEGRKV